MSTKIVIVTLFLLLTASSCSLDKRLARDFVKQSRNAQVTVYMTDVPDLVNSRLDFSEQELDGMPQEQRQARIDSMIQVLNKVNTDTLIAVFNGAFSQNLVKNYHLKLVDFEAEGQNADSLHWVLYVPKLELQEKRDEFEDVYFFIWGEGEYFYEYVPVTVLNLAAWLEINDGQWNNVLFAEQELSEEVDGKFDYSFITGQLIYNADIDKLEPVDAYNFAAFTGQLFSAYAYDYLLNKYVAEKLKMRGLQTRNYYRYDPFTKRLNPTESERLQVIE